MPMLKESCKAWIDKQPGGPNKLIAIGTYEAPTGGYKAWIERAVPQGINPNIIILEVRIVKPTGNVTMMVTRIPLRYEETPPNHPYTDATFRSDIPEFTVAVTITH